MPEISVLMPVYNGAATVQRAVESLRRQTFADWEVLAVDDASTDGGAEILREWARRDPRVRVLFLPENRGPAAARNVGLREARGGIVAYLDCDDEYYPDFLEQVHHLRGRADVIVFGYDCVGDGGETAPLQTWNPASRRHMFFDTNLTTPLGIAHRRSLFDRAGGFDEDSWIQEDWDYWRRLARAGAEFLFVPYRSGRYHFRPGSRSHQPRLTERQRAVFEARWSAGRPLYEPRAGPPGRQPPRRILFAAPFSLLDRTNVITTDALNILHLLSGQGFACLALGAPRSDRVPRSEDNDRPVVQETPGVPCEAVDAMCGPFRARVVYARSGRVPVTLIRPYSSPSGGPRDQNAAGSEALAARMLEPVTVAAFFEKAFSALQPDVVLTFSPNPSLDPIVRLARHRDLPVVAIPFDLPRMNQWAFGNVDYCLVTSEASRARYWQTLRLACVAMPPPTDSEEVGQAYADFFRDVHPQPGPPFVPMP